MTTINSTTSIVLTSLENIEREIKDLKKLIGEKPNVRRSLRGLWRGASITEEDINEVRREWMKELDDFNDNDN